ncbi:MAG: hypothetical protein J2P16_17360, partial [Mycobacterium sp.]|nr:hypothetical protein [Mycobacterium sp.]
MWSLGNESGWGSNFGMEYDYAKAEDPTRPVIFSCGCGDSDPAIKTDIVSVHYPSFNGPFGGESKPVLDDEYAPLPAVTIDQGEQRRDPNVENWWGETLQRLWPKVFTAPGALGGAIWAGIDDSFLAPNGPAGYGEWGLLDVWRRPRPEYWLTQKAYSPVRITDGPLAWPVASKTVQIPVGNWFDFTNLDETRIAWSAGGQSGTITGPNVAPHANGTISIPISSLNPNDVLDLKITRGGELIDEYRLPFQPGDSPTTIDPTVSDSAPAPKLSEDASHVTVTGSDFQVRFSKATGLIDDAALNGSTLIASGPYLNLVGANGGSPLQPWTLDGISAQPHAGTIVVTIRGHYGTVDVTFTVTIDGNAQLSTTYTIGHPPAGSYAEVGVTYLVPDTVNQVDWSRKALWSAYPADHIGRPTGTATKTGDNNQYGVAPTAPWSQDDKQYALFGKNDPGGRGSIDFRAAKQNIYYASAIAAGSTARLRAESNGTDSVRLETAQARLGLSNAATGPCSTQKCIDDADPSITYTGT